MLNYKEIKNKSVVIIQNPEEVYDINFLIPVRHRKEFAQPMYESFLKAQEKSSLKITYTVIEHSLTPGHAKFCKKNKINYIWNECEDSDLFNKCLCYNLGALYSNLSKYILFHDIDCLIPTNFFNNLMDNINNQNKELSNYFDGDGKEKKCRAIQCFQQRRVLYCNEELTKQIMKEGVDVDSLSLEHPNVDLPRLGGKVMLGAPGGSILVDRELFFEVGGYDADLFLANSPEDIHFWTKIDLWDKMYTSEDPPIDIFHMYHPPTYFSNPRLNEMKAIHEDFKKLSLARQMKEILNRGEHIKKFLP